MNQNASAQRGLSDQEVARKLRQGDYKELPSKKQRTVLHIVLLPLLLGTPLAFAPVHIVFLEMIINPTCAIVFETEEAESDIMKRPPTRIEERLFGTQNVLLSCLQGAGLLVAVACVFFYGIRNGMADTEARTLAFTSLVTGSLGPIIANRSLLRGAFALVRISNRAQCWIFGATAIALVAVLYTPALRRIFHFSPVRTNALVLAVLAGIAAIAWFECAKYAVRRAPGAMPSLAGSRRPRAGTGIDR